MAGDGTRNGACNVGAVEGALLANTTFGRASLVIHLHVVVSIKGVRATVRDAVVEARMGKPRMGKPKLHPL